MEQKEKNIIIYASMALVILLVIGSAVFLYFGRQEKRGEYDPLSIDPYYFTVKDQLPAERYAETLKALNEQLTKIKADQKNFSPWFEFGSLKFSLGDYEGARVAWETSFVLNPLKFATLNNLGDLYANFIVDNQKAEFFYLKALENRADNYSVYTKLADLYRYKMTNKNNEIEPLLLRAISENKANQLFYLEYLYNFFTDQNNTAKIKEYQQKILAIDRNFFNKKK